MVGDKQITLRYAGSCALCSREVPKGTRAVFNASSRSVRHLDCEPTDQQGVAGGSARREYERRRAKDDARIAAQTSKAQEVFGTGLLGRVATFLAVDDRPRRSTEVWAQGAVGEEVVAARLDALAEVGVVSLHDRGIPGSRANIDHIAVTPWGIWVIDAKRYLHKRPELVIEGGFLGIGGSSHLKVGGRRKDELVNGVLRQVELVAEVVGDAGPVRGALAFVEADWPLIGGDFEVRGVAVVWPRRLPKLMLRRDAPTVDVAAVATSLAARFPMA